MWCYFLTILAVFFKENEEYGGVVLFTIPTNGRPFISYYPIGILRLATYYSGWALIYTGCYYYFVEIM